MLDIAFLEKIIQSETSQAENSHTHKECETFYIISGNLNVYIQDKQIKVEKGGLVFINSNITHYTISKDPYELVLLRFRQNLLLKWHHIVPDIDFSRLFNREFMYLNPGSMDQVFIQGIMKTLLTSFEARMHGVFNLKIVEFIVYLVLKTAIADGIPCSFGSEVKKRRFYEIIDYMARQDYIVSLDELSEKFFISRYYICHMFKEVSGMTIKEYLYTKRVHKAQELLENSELPITTIADKCGFESIGTFDRIFKSYTGVSPSTFRKRYKKFFVTTDL